MLQITSTTKSANTSEADSFHNKPPETTTSKQETKNIKSDFGELKHKIQITHTHTICSITDPNEVHKNFLKNHSTQQNKNDKIGF